MPRIGTLGTISEGGVAPPLQTRRKFDRTNEITFRERTTAPFLHVLTTNMQRKPTGDPKFNHWEDGEMKWKFDIAGNSGGAAATLTTSATELYIADAGRYLRTGDRLHIPASQANMDGVAAVRSRGEVMRVVSISGDVVTVIRNTATASNVKTASAVTLGAVNLGAAHREGGASPDALNTVLGEGHNFCQIFKEPINLTGTLLATDMYGLSEKQRKLRLARNKVAREIERSFLHGVRDMWYEGGQPVRSCGGVMEWLFTPESLSDPDGDLQDYLNAATDSGHDLVTGDHTSRIHNLGGSLTWNGMLSYLEWAFAYGGKSKWALAGPSFMTEFQKLFQNRVEVNAVYSGKYGLHVTDVVTPHGNLHMVNEPEFFAVAEGESATVPMGYSNALLVLDMEYLGYRYTVAKEGGKNFQYGGERNLRLIEGIQLPGSDQLKDEFHAEVGPQMKFGKAHSMMIGVETSGITGI